MMRRLILGMMALLFGAGAAMASVIHDDGGTNPIGVGDEAGQYRSVESVSFDFTSTLGDRILSFDLFGRRSVDGVNDWQDVFSVLINGVELLNASFNLGGGGTHEVYSNPNGWSWSVASSGMWEGGIASVSGLVTLLDGVNTMTVSFASPGLANGPGGQGIWDESWALNAVTLAAVPLPAGFPLLGLALAGLAGLRRRAKA
jgi:hypothetical protein